MTDDETPDTPPPGARPPKATPKIIGTAEITTERFGRPFRKLAAAVSTEAMAQAWARQEEAPSGATVVVEREVSPLARRGRLWSTPWDATLACSVVLRPALAADDADAVWLMVGVAAAGAAESASGSEMTIQWPDIIFDGDGSRVAETKADVQLGPGQVRSAVVTARLDVPRLGLDASNHEELLETYLRALDAVVATLDEPEGLAGVAAAYERRCPMVGRRVKVGLRPRGETRGIVRGIDRRARLELESATGMVERITIDMLGDYSIL